MEMIPEAVFEAIKHIVPRKKAGVGRPEMCSRKALNAMWYVIKTGCQWSMLPNELGCSSTVHGKFIQWCRSGVMKKIMDSAANTHDSKLFEPVLAQIKKKKKVRIMAADSAFDVRRLYVKCKEKTLL